MTEREAPAASLADHGGAALPEAAVPVPRAAVEDVSDRMSGMAIFAVTLTAVLSLGWFLVSWAMFNSPLVDAIGETAGTLAVVLLLVSIVGAVRRR